MNPQEEVLIGQPKPKLDQFNDQKVLQSHQAPYKIKKIIVQFNSDHVWGIKAIYHTANGKEVKGESSMKFKPLRRMFTSLTKDTFSVADDDFIKTIHGHVSTEINQIGFETYKGHKASFGAAKGVPFSFHFPQHTFSIARGAYDKFLNFIAFKVVRLPQPFIDKYVNCPMPKMEVNVFVQPQQFNQPPVNNYPQINTNYPPPGNQPPPPPPQGNYPPPQGNYPPPQGNYPPSQGNYPPPQGNYPPPQNYPGNQPPPQNYPPPQPMPQYNYPPPNYPQQNYPQNQPQMVVVNQMPPPPPPKQVIVYENQPQHHGMGVGTAMALGAVGAFGTVGLIHQIDHHNAHHGHHGHHGHHH